MMVREDMGGRDQYVELSFGGAQENPWAAAIFCAGGYVRATIA
ncbi:MAG TPA: hypothetical protein VFG50_12175 [Rhodothermales bacterium]|nr:hypothetical protein [Rhodothermales bacterium]